MYVKISTLGCKVNQYESEAMLKSLTEHGFIPCGKETAADVVVVNSCTVTAESDAKVRQTLRRLKRDNPGAISVLTGCMPQAFPDKMQSFDEADIIIGTKNRLSLHNYITAFLSERTPILDIAPHKSGDKFESMSIENFTERTRAFIKIQDGCNRFCSYCIIPYARGRARSKQPEEILKEVKQLSENGYKEIVLTGINLPAYGQDLGLELCDAVEAVCKIEGIERVRLGSLEPERMDKKVIERFAAQKKLCPQFHLSLQSGCDNTLRAMNRHYTSGEYHKIVRDLRSAFKNPSITTDIVVGFAGETEEDFEQSLKFAEEIGFAKIHVFAYSRRPGTKAYDAPNQVPKSIKTMRSKRMLAAAEQSRIKFFETQLGLTEPVLVEREITEHTYEGYTMNYTPVRMKSAENICGQVVNVKLTAVAEDYCIGNIGFACLTSKLSGR